MRSGVTLVFVLVMKKQEQSKMSERYSIYIEGVEKFSDLSQFEFFDIMEDLAIEFYQTGKPNPSDIRTEIIGE